MVNMLAKWLELDPGYVECCLDPICSMFVFSHSQIVFQNMVKSEGITPECPKHSGFSNSLKFAHTEGGLSFV